MECPAEVRFLCVEDEQSWQERIRDATNHEAGIRLDTATTYVDATRLIKVNHYDVCCLDSRLDSGRPYLHELIKLARTFWDDSTVLVAITHFVDADVSDEDAKKVFRVIEKNTPDADAESLQLTLLEAVQASLRSQAHKLWRELGIDGLAETDDELFDRLRQVAEETSVGLCASAISIIQKYDVYARRRANIQKVFLDCTGYVESICGGQVEVVLLLPNGQQSRRAFDRSRFLAANLHFRDAQFRYTIRQKGASVYSRVEALSATQNLQYDKPSISDRFRPQDNANDDTAQG